MLLPAKQDATTRCSFLGEFSSIKSYGLVGDYLCGATTFGEAVRLLVSVMHSHASHDRISFRHSRSGYTCIYHAALRNQKEYPHYATLALTVVLTIAETYFERRYRREISFNFSKPRGTANYEEFFGCNVRFDQPELSIMFDRAAECATRQVHSSSSVNLVDVLDDAFGTPPTSILSAVKALVQGNLPEHIGVGRIAQQLDLSERTLRRRLEDHGTNFRHLSGNLRVELAHQLLTLTDLEITEIAHRVGYSDSSHLGRAYRQWTGMPVSQARTPSQTN
jgi:AraC-like DNA-binding protein